MNNSQQYNEYEKVIDLKDLLAAILDKWLIVLVCIIIGALGGAGFSVIKSNQSHNITVTEKDVETAKNELDVEQISQVDYLYAQYRSYKEYRKMIQEYMSDSLFLDEDINLICNVMYYVESDINDVSSCFTTLAVGKDEMEQIAGILGADNAMLDDVNRRVSIESNIINLANNYKNIAIDVNDHNDADSNKDIINVTVAVDSEEQAEAMLDVIYTAFQKEAEILRGMDPELKLTEIGRQYSSDLGAYMRKQQDAVIDSLNYANNQITSLQTNYIDKLQRDEKAYFDALKNYDDREIIVVKKPSMKKCIVIGAVIGLLLSIIILILWYIFNGTVKKTEDVSGYFRTDVPYVVNKKKPGSHLFGLWSRKLKGADLSDEAVVVELVASDLNIKLSKMNCYSAYIACDEMSPWNKEILQQLQDKIQKEGSKLSIHAGNPLSVTEELHLFSESDAVILMVQLKKTPYKTMDKWVQLICRYDRSVAGAIVMEEC